MTAGRRLRFLVLGPLAVDRGCGPEPVPGRRDQAVLAALLAHRNTVIPAERLADWVWSGEAPRTRNALQARVSHLRRFLGPVDASRLEYHAGGYLLRVSACEVDDEELAQAAEQARMLLGSDQPSMARDRLSAALKLWRGAPYSPHDEATFTTMAAAGVNELYQSALELHARATLEAGDPIEAIMLARRLVEDQPLRPAGRVVLMQALDATERRAEALEVYDRGRRLLAEVAGLEPAPELRAAQQKILAEERSRTRSQVGGPGVLDTVEMLRWLAGEGDVVASLRLGARSAWGWWLTGERSRASALISDLLVMHRRTGCSDRALELRARAWAGALSAHEHDEHQALRGAREALIALGAGWSSADALAALLLAERHHERGERQTAQSLLVPALQHLRADKDEWGIALAKLVHARGMLLTGASDEAERSASEALTIFQHLADPAGQLVGLDLLGYAREVGGDYRRAGEHHQRAMEYATHRGWLHAQAMQLARLGNVLLLEGDTNRSRDRLDEALALARHIGSPGLESYALNGLALVAARTGQLSRAHDSYGSVELVSKHRFPFRRGFHGRCSLAHHRRRHDTQITPSRGPGGRGQDG